MRVTLVFAVAALLAVTVSGCSGGGRTLTVFAAASLTEAFGALQQRFEHDHPGVDVRLSVGGSSTLAQQIVEGAPVDVFASADERTMREVADAGRLDGTPAVFATNTLMIAVQPGNPHHIRRFADLGAGGLTVIVCAPQVPCGAAIEHVERSTGVTLRPASEEQNVKAVLTKVEAGEADAGLVYASDVASTDRVEGVPFPETSSAVNTYPVAVLADAPEPGLARQFQELVLGPVGQRELVKAGFGAP